MQRRRSFNCILVFMFILGASGLQVQQTSAAEADRRPGAGGAPGINIAITRPVTASSETTTEPAANAVDGDPTLHWCPAPGSPSARLTVDLGEQQHINGTGTTWVTQPAGNYTLEVSANGRQWRSFPGIRSGG